MELKFLRKPEWKLIQEADRSRIKPPLAAIPNLISINFFAMNFGG